MSDCIPYSETPYFSDLINDYLKEDKKLQAFYGNFPTLENFEKQIDQKAKSFSSDSRKSLVEALKNQYKNVAVSEETQANLDFLAQSNTFTITTGHQLNLFTGPLYFLYKIISTIKLTQQLSEKYTDYNFVPIYWMATEDHDFEEINFFNFKEEKIQWNSKQQGPVGRFSTDGLDTLFAQFTEELNESDAGEELKKLFEKAYVKHNTLTEATRYLANTLFKSYGLVIVDGDDVNLKQEFVPYVKNELLQQSSFEKVSETAEKLAAQDYKVQVNPREINLFYLKNGLRERIVKEEGRYFIHETELSFSEEELLQELEQHPKRFSPNVIMRPLYQEVVLPNLCYIGGGGELAYWFELKSYFEAEKVAFPILLLRNSALLVNQKQQNKAENLGVSIGDLFQPQAELLSKRTKEISEIDIDFSEQKEFLQQQFKDLYTLAENTDQSFLGAVSAQEKKQLNGLDHLEKRLLTAQKRKLKDELDRLVTLQDQLFPKQSLQERQTNFSEFYEAYGKQLIPQIFEALDPLDLKFTVITLKD